MEKRRLKPETIQEIERLRKKGFSLPEISNTVKIPKTTVFRYTRGVNILPKYKKNWKIKRGGSRKRKLKGEKQALKEARGLINDLSYKEKILFLAALYWAEGGKKDFSISNTDPDLIRVFVKGLGDVFSIEKDRLRISIRLYEDLDKEECLSYWSDITGVPREKFVNINMLPGKKKGKLKYGMCRIRVSKGGDLLKKIKAINKMVINRFALIA